MNKSSIVSLFLVLTVTTVLVEMTANDYLQLNFSANVLGAPESQSEIAEIFDPTPSENESTLADYEGVDDLPKPRTSDVEGLPKSSEFSIEALRESGFFDPYVSVVSPVEFIYGVLDVPDQFLDDQQQIQIMEENTSVAIIQKFETDSDLKAAELFKAILEQGEAVEYFEVNQTNGYGDESFFLNHNVNKDQVFLVIKRKNKLVALTYVKRLHPKFQNLIKRVF